MCVEVPHLRYVVAAAEHRSFRRAAAALNITQPTLSKRIREVEDRLSVLLFERSTGGVYPTAEGEAFVASARRVLAELEGMENRARAAKAGNAGRLDLGFYTSLSSGALAETLCGFAEQHAKVDINAMEDARSTLIPLLDRGAIDIAVVLGEPAHRDYAHMSLWSERIMVALHKTHPLAERDFVYWTDLTSERFLMSVRDPGPEIQDILFSKLTSPGNRPFVKHVKMNHDHLLGLVNRKRGISLICESSTGNLLAGVVYREVRDGNGPTRLGFVAYWRRNNDNPTLKQFLTLLESHPAVPSLLNGSAG
jgi:DNA-binding transcriptional LysR family regulator